LQGPLRCIWEYRAEEEKEQEKFDWFTSGKDDMRKEVGEYFEGKGI